MDQRIFIARLNIEHFRRKLAGEIDEPTRQTLGRLLAEEEARLTLLLGGGRLHKLFDAIARQAADFLDHRRSGLDRRESERQFVAMLDQLPFAVGLMDRDGNWISANLAMRRFAPEQIAPRDPQRIERWRAFDEDGRPLNPARWPSTRALRGETVTPGVAFIYAADDGRKIRLRVAAVPIRDLDGAIAGAIAVIEETEI